MVWRGLRRISLVSALLISLTMLNGVDAFADEDAHPGLAVGETAPEFTLPDQSGQDRSLEELLKEHNVARPTNEALIEAAKAHKDSDER